MQEASRTFRNQNPARGPSHRLGYPRKQQEHPLDPPAAQASRNAKPRRAHSAGHEEAFAPPLLIEGHQEPAAPDRPNLPIPIPRQKLTTADALKGTVAGYHSKAGLGEDPVACENLNRPGESLSHPGQLLPRLRHPWIPGTEEPRGPKQDPEGRFRPPDRSPVPMGARLEGQVHPSPTIHVVHEGAFEVLVEPEHHRNRKGAGKGPIRQGVGEDNERRPFTRGGVEINDVDRARRLVSHLLKQPLELYPLARLESLPVFLVRPDPVQIPIHVANSGLQSRKVARERYQSASLETPTWTLELAHHGLQRPKSRWLVSVQTGNPNDRGAAGTGAVGS